MQPDERTLTRIQAWIDEHFDQQVRDLQSLVRIPSVSRGAPEPGMPLGRGVHEALTAALQLANRLGFADTRSLDGLCGTVDCGAGEQMLCIMAHLDVVPAGAGWDGDPFSGQVRNGRIYGRGTQDDKGAAVSALYALAAVVAAGVPLRRRVRILLGCDEEAGMRCIERYKQTEPEPDLAFTPDADYPLVNSEMGICQAIYERPFSGAGLSIDCGSAPNVVPGEAAARLPFPAVPCAAPAGMEIVFDGHSVRVKGFGGHAASPEQAKNALQGLLAALAQQPLDAEALALVSGLHALFDFDVHGEGFGLDVTDASGALTLVPTMLRVDGSGARLTLDCRFPFAVTQQRLLAALDASLGALGFSRAQAGVKPGHFIDPEGELVKTLLSVYERHTGRPAKPLSIGGGTYARAFQNAVAFGVVPEGEPGCCHMPNESVPLERLRFDTAVMAEAIARLAGAPNGD